jgi:hypothetical protein
MVFAQSAPEITTQPTNRVALFGTNTVFFAAGTGTEPLFYQWQKDGTNLINGGRISGAMSSSLTVSNLQMSDVGNYSLILSNAYGGDTSTQASLLIVPIAAWGIGPDIPLTLTNVVAVSGDHLALRSDGTAVCWPSNDAPEGLSNVVAIAGGPSHNLALKGDGTVVGWGQNNSGQATVPAGLSNVVAIAVGWIHSLALRNDGTVIGWGTNIYGQAIPPEGLTNVVAIAAGVYHSLALKNDGTVVAWGTPLINDYQVTPPAGLTNVVAIAAGDYHSLALKTDGTVVGWGYNFYGQANSLSGLGFDVVAIAAGGYRSLALTKGSWVFGWGAGQATPPAGLSNVVAISAGEYGSLALVENPTVQIPPGIWWQPSDRTLPTGQTTIFSPYVSGSLPLRFQWYFDGAPLAGETNRWLALVSIQTNQAGGYYFVATNNYGSVTSQVAVVTESPGIMAQPAGAGVFLGSNACLTATVAGIGLLSCQWYFNGIPLTNSDRITGSTTPGLNISNFQLSDVGDYTLVIANAFGSATSAVATLSVAGPRFVNPGNPNPLFPYLDWATAATNIQDAVDAAVAGDTIFVTNGVYASGGAVVYGQETNRVALAKAVTLLSVNGPEATLIVGGTQTRCVYVGSNAVLSGFTITNGHARVNNGDVIKERTGGGIWCEVSGIVTNCLICSNTAYDNGGGGVYGGVLYYCRITGNSSYLGGGMHSSTAWNCTVNGNVNSIYSSCGGGAYLSALFNCIVSSNVTSVDGYGYGGGADQCILSNCLVIGNAALYSASGGGTASGTNYNCVIVGNSSRRSGAGTYGSVNYNCIISGNRSSDGGGTCDGQNYNCLITGNTVNWYGGGVEGGTHYNCTIVNNTVTNINGSGGGTYYGELYNSIIYFNSATNGPNWLGSTLNYCCTTPSGYITADPLFVNQADGNFRLRTNSPCINHGNSYYVVGNTDLDGRPRRVGFWVDIGAYEYQTNASGEFIGWLQQHGLPTGGSADYLDADGDGFNNWQEWRVGTDPTNSSSLLQMTSIAVTNSSSGATITWQSVSGVNYFVQRGTDLGTQPVFSTIQSSVVGQAGTTSYADTTATNSSAFYYRVGVP